MKLRHLSLAIALTLPFSATTLLAAPSAAKSMQVAPSKSEQLEQLYVDYWEASLKLNPLQATFVGDERYNDQLPNFFSPEYRDESIAFSQNWLKKFEAINPDDVTGQTRLSYDIMVRSLKLDLEGNQFRTDLMPLNQFGNIVGSFAQLGSGTSAQPFKTVQDYDNWFKRASKVPELLAQMQVNMREGMKIGMVQPKVLMIKVLPQLDDIAKDKLDENIFWLPIKNIPASFSAADKSRLTEQYRTLITQQINPSIKQLRTFVNDEYLPACRDTVGMQGLPDGQAIYAYRAKASTTTDLTPKQLHEIGLSEVARIHGEIRKIMAETKFKGSLQDFFHFMDTDKQFEYKDEQALLDRFNALRVKIDKKIPEFFAVTPKAGFEIRPIEAFRAASSAGGEYQGPSEDGTRPGIFYVNTYDLPTRKTWDSEDLYLHEAIPGHHFQIAIQQELTGIPKFRRFGGETAYAEGWGLYTETMGKELGVFTDPYMYFGGLQGELWRAIRLVVDTGLHDKGWTREQVIKYMRDNSAVSETDAIAEAERYMAIPGQALAYKVGQLKIRELRTRASNELGDKFDVREFHDQVLKDGSLPMSVLEAKIDRWIASKKK
ncbi:MAG TPA: DUF885 domain-containing protein [Arenimonas sp.]|nr:DUF885 domain-containing protein [Arenimonas sp.]HPW32493.1 DUF885 domain-containing protein [Arenimonas sp.]